MGGDTCPGRDLNPHEHMVQGILSPLCLPIPPPGRSEAPSGFEPLHKGFADLSLSHLGTAPGIDHQPFFVLKFMLST